jgi:hypothetical protein
MSTNEINNLDEPRQSVSEQRHSIHSLDDHTSPIMIEDEDDEPPLQELKSFSKPSQIPKFKSSKTLSKSMIITNHNEVSPSLKWNSSLKTR